MCIYYGNKEGLTYNSQEYVLPAALGCHTKLPKGTVSDQANAYFSPIERRVIKQSLIQIPRIIQGPGKRGSLSPNKATTSDVSVVAHAGSQCLGYMKGSEAFILDQFSIKIENDHVVRLTYHHGSKTNSHTTTATTETAYEGVRELQNKIRAWKHDKYVPIQMDSDLLLDPDLLFITSFKDKIYIGASEEITALHISIIKNFFSKDIAVENSSYKTLKGNPKIKLEVKHGFVDVAKIAAKVAINTLAYIVGADLILKSGDCDGIIKKILSDDDSILKNVSPIKDAKEIKKSCFLDGDFQACILAREGYKLFAYVFFYDECYFVNLSSYSNIDIGVIDGIVCDWEHEKDYRYQEYLKNLCVPIYCEV